MRRLLWPLWLLLDLIGWIGLILVSLLGPLLDQMLARRQSVRRTPILLVHGYLEAGGWMWPVGMRLKRRGFGPIEIVRYSSLGTRDAAISKILAAASRLAEECEARTVDVVAHSLGGLLAHLARDLQRKRSIGHVVSLGTPHHGTNLGRFAVGPMAGLLASGREGASSEPGDLSVSGESDLLALSHRCALAPPATSECIPGLGHSGLLWSGRVAESVVTHLRARER